MDEEPKAAKALHVPQQLVLTMPDEMRETVRAQWEHLSSSVDSMRPIERFQVVGISYRRHAPCCYV
jgi:hypothetical protein